MRRALVLAVVALAACGCGDDGPGPDITFTGGYEDWDSTEQDFLGINAAMVTEVGNESNTATTAPNGRSTLTLPGAESVVTFEAADYLPARFTVDPDAVVDPYEVRGITEARIATYYTELGAGAWDEGTALVEVTAPAGVTLTVGGESGTAHANAVVWPNVAVGDGTVSLEVDGGALTCHAPAAIHVAAGEVAIAAVGCE